MTTTTKGCRKTIKDLRACVTVRCCGHMHKIGLAHNGQLVLFNHTKDEVQRYVSMYELGADPSRCVSIYRAWITGTIHHDQHPEGLSAQRFPKYDFAKRVQRKLRRSRLKALLLGATEADRGELLRELRTLVGPSVKQEEIVELTNELAKYNSNNTYATNVNETKWFVRRVIDELTRRGWRKAVEAEPKPPSDCEERERTSSAVFSTDHRGDIYGLTPLDDPRRVAAAKYAWPCNSMNDMRVSVLGFGGGRRIRVADASETFISSFACGSKAEDMPLHLAADVAEVGYVNELLRYNTLRERAKTSVHFAGMTEKTALTSKISGLVLDEVEAYNTVNLTIQHSTLTIQAAQLLINAYRTIEPKVLAILRMNDKRLKAENRVPPTPEVHLAPTGQPVPKKLDKVELLFSSKEEEVDDTKNDTA